MEELLSKNPEFNKLYFEICNKLEEIRVASKRHDFDRLTITISTREDVTPGDYFILLSASKEHYNGYTSWYADITGKSESEAILSFSEMDYKYQKGVEKHEFTI